MFGRVTWSVPQSAAHAEPSAALRRLDAAGAVPSVGPMARAESVALLADRAPGLGRDTADHPDTEAGRTTPADTYHQAGRRSDAMPEHAPFHPDAIRAKQTLVEAANRPAFRAGAGGQDSGRAGCGAGAGAGQPGRLAERRGALVPGAASRANESTRSATHRPSSRSGEG